MTYGKLPRNLGRFDIHCTESMLYQDMPIKLAGQAWASLGRRLRRFEPLVDAIHNSMRHHEWVDRYVYLTAKHTYVGPGASPNRPGWHSDGFLSDDVSYLWFDSVPTIANLSQFQLTEDHAISLREMSDQADPLNDVALPCFHLLRLDPSVIHRVGDVQRPGMRTFVKIVVSDRQYNRQGNTHNYALDYDWPMQPRSAERNDPSTH